MNFEQALAAMREGKKVRRKDWSEKYYYRIRMKKTIVSHYNSVAHFISIEEILANDWEIVGDESK